jgi:hypothetical protein
MLTNPPPVDHVSPQQVSFRARRTRKELLSDRRSFRVNHAYVLPPSLRPTMVQRSNPHEHAIDGVIFPSVRDRMILLRGKLISHTQGNLG